MKAIQVIHVLRHCAVCHFDKKYEDNQASKYSVLASRYIPFNEKHVPQHRRYDCVLKFLFYVSDV